MPKLVGAYDDLLILAPSMLSSELLEGKSLGTAPEMDILFLDLDRTITPGASDPKEFAYQRKSGVTVGKRILKQVQQRVEPEMLKLVFGHDEGRSELKVFKKSMTRLMKGAWRDVFAAGVRSTGIAGKGKGKKGTLVTLTKADEKWLRSAMQHEMRFLNKMISAVEDGTWKMPLDRRVRMYILTLESFYDTARVIGLPATVIIRWMGPDDRKTCVGCEYLFDHSPYTKRTIPTTPRSGMTPCLSNCRDRLLIRQATPEKVIAQTEASKYTRSGHIRNLRKLKRQGHF